MEAINFREKYITPDGTELEGLGILDFYTESKTNRLTGDIVIESDTFGTIVGFENHGGRTYHNFGTLGHVTFGYGNNDKDKKAFIIKFIRYLFTRTNFT